MDTLLLPSCSSRTWQQAAAGLRLETWLRIPEALSEYSLIRQMNSECCYLESPPNCNTAPCLDEQMQSKSRSWGRIGVDSSDRFPGEGQHAFVFGYLPFMHTWPLLFCQKQALCLSMIRWSLIAKRKDQKPRKESGDEANFVLAWLVLGAVSTVLCVDTNRSVEFADVCRMWCLQPE